ncbi:DegQ family serine endoprotease [Amorphus sp. 3PC139-8]|uniref:DegQ family serine endoprotease n=1 Tax=Amorphus sp. 3PC139-8 TaxID=2735676 RepID=UPI00345C8AC4
MPTSQEQIQLSFAPIVKNAAPAVVNIYASRRVQRPRSPLLDDPLFRHFFGNQPGNGAPSRLQQSLGSGVIVAEDGVVITNNHVVRDADEIRIALADKREFDAEVLLKDERTDLAVLKIDADGESFPTLPFADSDELEVGDVVLAIGDPFGVGQTVTFGIVSALARTQVGITDYRFFIQTDAAINPGNSGGALIDSSGRLVGINSAIYSRSGGSLGIGFAIPANMARLVVRSALEDGEILRPWFGASMQAVTSDIADGLGLDRPRGALVTKVTEDGPADKGGVQVGDLILSIAGRAIDDPDGFGYRFVTQGVGGTTDLTVLRNGRRVDLDIALVSPPETTPRDTREITGYSPLTGATVMNLSPAVAEEVGLDFGDAGVVVAAIESGSPAQRIGLRRGDVIVDLNGTDIDSTRTLDGLIDERPRVWRLTIDRDGRTLQMAFRG